MTKQGHRHKLRALIKLNVKTFKTLKTSPKLSKPLKNSLTLKNFQKLSKTQKLLKNLKNSVKKL